MPQVKSIAIIGAGAIAESYYLPSLVQNPAWKPMVWLVEPSEKRRKQVAAQFGLSDAQHVASADDLPKNLDLAINCTPSHIHVATTMPFIERGVNVIVEKPLAESAADAASLVDAAKGRCVMSVNHHRRLGAASRQIHDIVRSGKLGAIKQVTWREGRKFEWPTQSGFNFRRPWAGRPRGAVLDVGVHVIDLLSWWLGEQLTVEKAVMDGYGGPECYAALNLASSTAKLDVVLSFHSKLANTFEIVGEKGAIRAGAGEYDQYEIRMGAGPWKAVRLGLPGPTELANTLLRNVIDAIENDAGLIIEAASTLPALNTIDEIYRTAVDPLPACYGEWAA